MEDPLRAPLAQAPSSRTTGSGNVLLEVALCLGSTLDLDQLAALVVERLQVMLCAERALFVLFDAHGGVERAVTHNLEWAGPGHPLPISRTVVAQVLASKALLVVPDASDDAQYQSAVSVQHLSLRFIFAMPVVVRDVVAGVLYVDSRARAMRDVAGMEDTLTALARLVATAVENARLFEEQRFRNLLLAQMVHDFRGLLTIIQTNAALLVREAEQEGRDADMALDVSSAAGQMSEMIESTLNLSRLDAGVHDAPFLLDVAGFVRQQVRTLEVVGRSLQVSFAVRQAGALPNAWVFRDRLRTVLGNLLMNALKFADAHSVVTVGLRLRDDVGPPDAVTRPLGDAARLFRRAPSLRPAPAAPFLEVSVHNHGAPVAPDLLPCVFHAWTTGSAGARGLSSTGLGLALVDQCVRSLGGCVWVDSDAVAGTSFVFTLPTALGEG